MVRPMQQNGTRRMQTMQSETSQEWAPSPQTRPQSRPEPACALPMNIFGAVRPRFVPSAASPCRSSCTMCHTRARLATSRTSLVTLCMHCRQITSLWFWPVIARGCHGRCLLLPLSPLEPEHRSWMVKHIQRPSSGL